MHSAFEVTFLMLHLKIHSFKLTFDTTTHGSAMSDLRLPSQRHSLSVDSIPNYSSLFRDNRKTDGVNNLPRVDSQPLAHWKANRWPVWAQVGRLILCTAYDHRKWYRLTTHTSYLLSTVSHTDICGKIVNLLWSAPIFGAFHCRVSSWISPKHVASENCRPIWISLCSWLRDNWFIRFYIVPSRDTQTRGRTERDNLL